MTLQERMPAVLPPPPGLDPSRDALFLDFDGVLVELAATPGAVEVAMELRDLLRRLHDSMEGAVAIVSGRTATEIDGFLGPLRLPLATSHGRSLRRTGEARDQLAVAIGIPSASRAVVDEVAGRTPGLLIEDKGDGVAIHYRAVPDAAERVAETAARAVEVSGGALTALPGKMVVELVPPGLDKGTGIAALMEQPPFAGRRPVFAGDDVTDEAGFRVVQAMGGVGIIVAERRPTEAATALLDVAAVHAWLAAAG